MHSTDCTAKCNEWETWSEHIVYWIRKIKETDFVFTLFLVENFYVVCMYIAQWVVSLTFIYYISQSISMHKQKKTHCALPVFLNDFHASSFCFLSFSRSSARYVIRSNWLSSFRLLIVYHIIGTSIFFLSFRAAPLWRRIMYAS